MKKKIIELNEDLEFFKINLTKRDIEVTIDALKLFIEEDLNTNHGDQSKGGHIAEDLKNKLIKCREKIS